MHARQTTVSPVSNVFFFFLVYTRTWLATLPSLAVASNLLLGTGAVWLELAIMAFPLWLSIPEPGHRHLQQH